MYFNIINRYFSFFLTWACLVLLSTPGYTQSSNSKIHMDYSNSLLSLTATNADLKTILQRLSDEAGIDIKYPEDLEMQLTINLSEVSLDRAIKKILKGINHAVIYSSSEKMKKSKIARIYVFEEAQSTPVNPREQRTLNSIKNYERRIESLRKRLETVDENSDRGKSYQKRIKSYEDMIEKLKANL